MMCAAKLKKRALAEYQSQVKEEDQKQKSSKKLKLTRLSRADSTCSTSRRLSAATSSCAGDHATLDSLLQQIISLTPSILDAALPNSEVCEFTKKLINSIQKYEVEDGNFRSQIYLALSHIISSYGIVHVPLEFIEEWLLPDFETNRKAKVSLFSFFCAFVSNDRPMTQKQQTKLLELIKLELGSQNHQVKVACLKVLGKGTHILSAQDRSLATNIMKIIHRHTMCQDPRVRKAAFEALLDVHNNGHKLDSGTYSDLCKALMDDYEGVRMVGLQLIHVMAISYPEEQVLEDSGTTSPRLIDDAFGKICNAVQDLSVQVRELSVKLIGTLHNVSPWFLEQTLDKKLMSNMRSKKSAHERQAQVVASGEWSSGKKWADDAPREEVDADSVNLMAMGACGAFIHGLEDEFLAVRSASIDSITALSIRNPKMANMALDFLVDMFNDEIEAVRLKAIEALTLIADHISLQVHQLETILWPLDDFSFIVREKLHDMLQSSNIATKDGLQNVISKLLENLKRYPQDKRSILVTCKKLGTTHSELVLPLVTQLLEIHPFFDTPEPDIEDPAYLCILVLVFNASYNCPTLDPLLDEHTKRHFQYLEDTFPHLLPDSKNHQKQTNNNNNINNQNTTKFATQIVTNVESSDCLKTEARMKILSQACTDLQRLASIEPTLRDASTFAHTYIRCQILMLRSLSSQLWTNGGAQIMMQGQQGQILSENITELFKLCLQLESKYSNLKPQQLKLIRILRLRIRALHLVFLMKATNKSALTSTELLLKELDNFEKNEDYRNFPFVQDLLQSLTDENQRKAGALVRLLTPLMVKYPIQSMPFDKDVTMAHAEIFEPVGNNETPLKYTAGMILAVPIDCELFNVEDPSLVRIAIQTPDQKIMLVTPKSTDFILKADGSRRLLTNALMSHQVWSEALHVELKLVLDMTAQSLNSSSSSSQRSSSQNLIALCDPIKIYVLPKAAKRGI